MDAARSSLNATGMWPTNASIVRSAGGGNVMNFRLPIVVAGMLAGSIVTAAADNPPKFNVAPGCKAAAAINQEMDLAVSQDYKSCMADEESAKQQLDQSWSTYKAVDQRRCVGQTTDGGMPSYVEVLECLLVTVGVDNPIPPLATGAPSGGSQQPLVGVKKAKTQKNPPQKTQ
jgi:hypothetical protein